MTRWLCPICGRIAEVHEAVTLVECSGKDRKHATKKMIRQETK